MEEIYNSSVYLQGKTCVALGNFDGVHLGHREIIKAAVGYARLMQVRSCVYTFTEHPSLALGNNKPILTTNNEKSETIGSFGCDSIYFEDFSLVRNMAPAEFCKKILQDKLNACCVFCGENYRFGYKGEGNTRILKSELDKLNIKLMVIPYIYDKDAKLISSTEIRKLISCGDVLSASQMMGEYYRISGTVMHGKQLGRKLGFPTLNISIPENKLVPKHGVYLSKCILDGKVYNSISNIGLRPTTDSNLSCELLANCETFLLDYHADAYGKNITVYLMDMLRPEMKFDTVQQLREQISKDVSLADSIFTKQYRS